VEQLLSQADPDGHHHDYGRKKSSVALRSLREVTPHIQGRGQLKDDVRQRGVLQQFVRRQLRLTAGSHVPPPESTVQPKHHITEDETEDQGAQEVVAEELHVGGICQGR